MTSRLFTISAAVVLLGGAPAVAQTNGWLSGASTYAADDYRAPYADARRAAYDNGYRDGLKRGEQAVRDGRALNVEIERDYRKAEGGYNRSYGDRSRYRDDYRGGFAQGYRDGYGRRGSRSQYPATFPGNSSDGRDNGYGRDDGYGRPDDYGYGRRDTDDYGYGRADSDDRRYGRGAPNAGYGAFQNGASDGYRKGLEDLQDRRSPDVTRHKWYRSGDHDYDKRYGTKELYRNEYRRGFEDGYYRAFRGAGAAAGIGRRR